jgi:hypothetical protein
MTSSEEVANQQLAASFWLSDTLARLLAGALRDSAVDTVFLAPKQCWLQALK